MKYLVGIDEAGRGPLAGPVTVGVAVVPIDFDWSILLGVGDSKQLSEAKREQIFERARELKKTGALDFAVGQMAAAMIDARGIVGAVEAAMRSALAKLDLSPEECEIRLDGSLRAPIAYPNQITIIKGDATEPVIGLASIMAKVTRDRQMTRLATKPELTPYNFEIHKGYGTKRHRELIQIHGLSRIHRQSFCRNIQIGKGLV